MSTNFAKKAAIAAAFAALAATSAQAQVDFAQRNITQAYSLADLIAVTGDGVTQLNDVETATVTSDGRLIVSLESNAPTAFNNYLLELFPNGDGTNRRVINEAGLDAGDLSGTASAPDFRFQTGVAVSGGTAVMADWDVLAGSAETRLVAVNLAAGTAASLGTSSPDLEAGSDIVPVAGGYAYIRGGGSFGANDSLWFIDGTTGARTQVLAAADFETASGLGAGADSGFFTLATDSTNRLYIVAQDTTAAGTTTAPRSRILRLDNPTVASTAANLTNVTPAPWETIGIRNFAVDTAGNFYITAVQTGATPLAGQATLRVWNGTSEVVSLTTDALVAAAVNPDPAANAFDVRFTVGLTGRTISATQSEVYLVNRNDGVDQGVAGDTYSILRVVFGASTAPASASGAWSLYE
ncbi:MAG: hypothetical protein SF028_12240 [Candidatus Sumerlaeia bacterium]|nr:hypothetical protein [Candidatus Sumerlaeia bacterium]